MIDRCNLLCKRGHYQTSGSKEVNGTCSVCAKIDFHEHYLRNVEKKKAYQREYRLKNIDQIKKKDRLKHLRRNYGMTGVEYEMMMASQNGKCAICGKSEWAKCGNLSVDHDHKTGKVRGLICNWCNYGIGFLDNENFMESAMKYLKRDQ